MSLQSWFLRHVRYYKDIFCYCDHTKLCFWYHSLASQPSTSSPTVSSPACGPHHSSLQSCPYLSTPSAASPPIAPSRLGPATAHHAFCPLPQATAGTSNDSGWQGGRRYLKCLRAGPPPPHLRRLQRLPPRQSLASLTAASPPHHPSPSPPIAP
jgi:hypothetical protein